MKILEEVDQIIWYYIMVNILYLIKGFRSYFGQYCLYLLM